MRLLELKEDKSYQPPSIDVGDEVLVGKFKNRRAEVKGFTTDDNNQPVLKTSKGDQHLFKPRIAKLMPNEVNEAFDKPYELLRWEQGDFGDVDAIARLDDGTFLSIMFNKGFSKGSKEEAWSVEFYRNNSQEVTGEGDQQRVFATVLSAIQTFIKKYTPNRITFSASKEVDQGQNAQSRARLYDSLVQRYARSWGFRAFRADTSNKVIYELNRIKPVTEGTENNLSTIIQSFVNGPIGQKYKQYDCKTVTRAFVQWAEQNKIPTQVVSLAPPSADFIAKNPRYKGKSGQGDGHIMPIVNGNAIDFTVRQFGVSRPFNNPLVTPTSSLPVVYGKFGYFTDKPEWFLGGKSHWIGALNSIPSEIFNQNFGDEMLEHTMAENFADGRVKGKSRPGRVKRSGASCDGSVTDLRSKAKDASGERAKMYHWCANMKSGRAKTESEILEDLNVIWKDVLEAGVYKGYPCTKDCSGHAAGDRWADARDITDPNLCPYSNNSFWEGCLAHTDEQE